MKKYIAECIGTFVLVVFGCGTAVIANSLLMGMGMALPQGFTILAIAVAFGLAIVAMAYSIGNVSGCHINPAVSTGMLVAGKMTVQDFIGYIIAQFAGATLGAAFLWLVLQENTSLGQNGYGEASVVGLDMTRALIVEVVLTFIFVLVILGVTSKKQYESVAGVVIGLTLTVIHLFGIPLTGTSVNPARSFGPAVITAFDNTAAVSQLPVFIIAPLIGGVIAALVYKLVLEEEPEIEEAEEATVYSESTHGMSRDNVIYQGGTEAKRLASSEQTETAAQTAPQTAAQQVVAETAAQPVAVSGNKEAAPAPAKASQANATAAAAGSAKLAMAKKAAAKKRIAEAKKAKAAKRSRYGAKSTKAAVRGK